MTIPLLIPLHGQMECVYMTDKDRQKWNAKYNDDTGANSPTDKVIQYHDRVTPGPALDIACGNGRNSIFLTKKGFNVDAVDISNIATDRLKHRHAGINTLCMDLDTWEIPRDHYQLIINVRFLDRCLFPQIQEGLKKGGLLIFESFLEGTDEDEGHPHHRSYLLRKNELLHAFLNLHILFYEERKERHHNQNSLMATLVARKN